jgi:hypothetical protein
MLLSTAQTDLGLDLTCEDRPSDSPFVERVWRSESPYDAPFISMADSHWSIVVTKLHGKPHITVRGPETRATPAYGPGNAEFFGIHFKPDTLFPDFPARQLMDRCDVHLPEAGSRSFWLKGSAWEFPDYNNAEAFVERLVREGLLIRDPVIGAVLQGQPPPTSLRTVQRRFLTATGLTNTTIYQIERARKAAALLKQGISILDTVEQADYFDQPHLTRSLKRYIGLTPAQISDSNRTERLSFLYKTSSSG